MTSKMIGASLSGYRHLALILSQMDYKVQQKEQEVNLYTQYTPFAVRNAFIYTRLLLTRIKTSRGYVETTRASPQTLRFTQTTTYAGELRGQPQLLALQCFIRLFIRRGLLISADSRLMLARFRAFYQQPPRPGVVHHSRRPLRLRHVRNSRPRRPAKSRPAR
jgi:hypothetical protein